MTTTREEFDEASSLDFDGCYGHAGCTGQQNIDNNQGLIENIRGNPHSKKILFVGSLRQDHANDAHCDKLNYNGSCFSEMLFLENYLRSQNIPVELNKFLLADIDSNKELGYSFNRALDKDPAISHPVWKRDHTKLRILYAQMHLLASLKPRKKTIYNFYDDRDDMLRGLLALFQRYPMLKPGNVKLQLHYYFGTGKPLLFGICDFSDEPIDYNWPHNVKLLGSDQFRNFVAGDYEVDFTQISKFLRARKMILPGIEIPTKEKLAFDLANSFLKKAMYKEALKIYLEIDPVKLSSKDKELYFSNLESTYNNVASALVVEEKPIRSTTFTEPLLARNPGYLEMATLSSSVNDSGYESKMGITQSEFIKIIGNHESKSCFCGLFGKRDGIKALRELSQKDWITGEEIEDAILTDKEGVRRFNLFRNVKSKTDNSKTDKMIIALSEACNPKPALQPCQGIF